jgi:deoxyribonuclease-1
MHRLNQQLIVLLFCCSAAMADQFELANIVESEQVFWQKLQPDGGWTLYCGEHFSKPNEDLMMHAIYPMEWVATHLECGEIESCRATSVRFNRIEADLHNYYPTLVMTGRSRNGYKFGEISGEYRQFFECNFEVDGGAKIVEPRQEARGNIARAIFYMLDEYQLPVPKDQVDLLKLWNRDDPPSSDEKRRNDLIESLQGTRNGFIDDPSRITKMFP